MYANVNTDLGVRNKFKKKKANNNFKKIKREKKREKKTASILCTLTSKQNSIR